MPVNAIPQLSPPSAIHRHHSLSPPFDIRHPSPSTSPFPATVAVPSRCPAARAGRVDRVSDWPAAFIGRFYILAVTVSLRDGYINFLNRFFLTGAGLQKNGN